MKIIFSKKYVKMFDKLQQADQKKVIKTLQAFKKDPFDKKLRNHELKGNKKGIRSIDAAFDLRILYKEKGNHMIVLMLQVGSHSEIYRNK